MQQMMAAMALQGAKMKGFLIRAVRGVSLSRRIHVL